MGAFKGHYMRVRALTRTAQLHSVSIARNQSGLDGTATNLHLILHQTRVTSPYAHTDTSVTGRRVCVGPAAFVHVISRPPTTPRLTINMSTQGGLKNSA